MLGKPLLLAFYHLFSFISALTHTILFLEQADVPILPYSFILGKIVLSFRPVSDYFKTILSIVKSASHILSSFLWFQMIFEFGLWHFGSIKSTWMRKGERPFLSSPFSTSFVRQTRGVDSDYFGEKYKKLPQSLIQVFISDTL